MNQQQKIRVGILGGTGYTGQELIRLLQFHPAAELIGVSSSSKAGQKISQSFPQFSFLQDSVFLDESELLGKKPDCLFLGLPHRISMEFVARCPQDLTIVDLSGDFRLKDPQTYEQWYQHAHQCPEAIEQFTYGLPELRRHEIKRHSRVANPGCYPTASILACYPAVRFLQQKEESIICNIDAKSGVTGAGAKLSSQTHFPHLNDNFWAYGIHSHRHTPEIEQELDAEMNLQFTPHLLPINRGILATCLFFNVSEQNWQEIYETQYASEPFVRLRSAPPQIKDVKGSNFCDLYVDYNPRKQNLVVITAIDNLVKGAAGQAIQNFNLLFDLEETTGLLTPPLTL